MPDQRETFEGWAILELMGHRRLGGYVREQQIAGAAFIRIDVHGDGPVGEYEVEQATATQFYAPAAIYCITPTTEQMARAAAGTVAPITEWELRRALPAPTPEPGPEVDYSELDEEDEHDHADLSGEALDLDPDQIPF